VAAPTSRPPANAAVVSVLGRGAGAAADDAEQRQRPGQPARGRLTRFARPQAGEPKQQQQVEALRRAQRKRHRNTRQAARQDEHRQVERRVQIGARLRRQQVETVPSRQQRVGGVVVIVEEIEIDVLAARHRRHTEGHQRRQQQERRPQHAAA
jgi:hypothetical protein